MGNSDSSRAPYKTLAFLFFAYTLATTLHFIHNAVFLSDYPNMPGWISQSGVYGALAVVVSVGASGGLLYLFSYRLCGLILIGVYAALGFDGLGHYALAPISAHGLAMNLTIGLEVATAALLFALIVAIVARHGLQAPLLSRVPPERPRASPPAPYP